MPHRKKLPSPLGRKLYLQESYLSSHPQLLSSFDRYFVSAVLSMSVVELEAVLNLLSDLLRYLMGYITIIILELKDTHSLAKSTEH